MVSTTKRWLTDRCPASIRHTATIFILLCSITFSITASQSMQPKKDYRDARMLPAPSTSSRDELTLTDKTSGSDVDARVDCRVDGMFLVMNLGDKSFTGRVYPKGFSKTPCAQLYTNNGSRITYEVPMNTCNTMVNDFENGTREYHNMIVVQHHQTLVTKKDRSYAVRCRYRASEQLLQAGVGVDNMEVDPVEATAPAPIVEMLLLADASRQAEFVNIGDPLTMQVQIPAQRMYGILVHSCVVRDGAGVGGLQVLYDERGCPVEPDIMGALQYKNDLTQASVTFKAHKFPYTTSLYYECHVQFCLKPTGECERLPTKFRFWSQAQPPKCGRQDASLASSSSSLAASSSLPAAIDSSNAVDDDNISHLITSDSVTAASASSSAAQQTPSSTTAFTTIKFQPSTIVNNQQQATLGNIRRNDPSRLPIKSSTAENKEDLPFVPMKDQSQPSVAVEDMLLPSSSTADQAVVRPVSQKPASSSSVASSSAMMKRPQIVVEEQQVDVQPLETPVSPTISLASTATITTTTTTTTARPVTTPTGTTTKSTTMSPVTSRSLRSRSLVEQKSRMLLANEDDEQQPPVHEVIGFSSEAAFPQTSSTASPPPPATTTTRIVTTAAGGNIGYAAVEPLSTSDITVTNGRQAYARKARSISFATLSPNSQLDNSIEEDDYNTRYHEKLRRYQQKRKLEASLGGEVIEFVPKSSASSLSSVWEPQASPHVETLIGYYDGARDDDYDLIRTRRDASTNNSRARRSTLTSSSSSIEVGRTAREAKVVRGLNVIDVSEPVPNYLMQAYKSQNGGGQPPTITNDSINLPTPQYCMSTSTFAAGVSAAGVLCLLSAIVIGAAACSRCKRRRDDDSEILGSECATAATGVGGGEIISSHHHLANAYSNPALFAAAVGYPTLTHGASCSSPYVAHGNGLMAHSASPPNDSHAYRYSSYAPKEQYSFS